MSADEWARLRAQFLALPGPVRHGVAGVAVVMALAAWFGACLITGRIAYALVGDWGAFGAGVVFFAGIVGAVCAATQWSDERDERTRKEAEAEHLRRMRGERP